MLMLCLFFPFSLCSNQCTPNEPYDYEVLTLSAAIVDHYFFISENELKAVSTEKGGWAPIDYSTLKAIMEQGINVSKMVTGGSGANVIKGMAQLGDKCGIVGKVGDDEKGKYYAKKLKDLGITPLFEKGSLPTGQAICLITPDGERTFRTYLGASHSLSSLCLGEEIWPKHLKLFHVEGYQLLDRDLIVRVLKYAKNRNVKISLDLANIEIVRRNKEFVEDILKKYVDIVFCNEREAQILTDSSARESCHLLAEWCEIAVVTMSERGSWVQKGDDRIFMEALSTTGVIDTTGAGDLYAAGFLHGYLKGYPLKKCAWIGALTSSYVVKRIGAEISEAVWEEIHERILAEGMSFDT
ncbi:MAG: adenosine kinase [Chlamydiales bacterium]|nr:adenosine kinase [Chlamydiales bacterium]